MVILPSTSETVAHLIMSQIKSVVEQNLKTDGGSQVTLSVGVMEAKAHSQESRNIAVEDVETMPRAQRKQSLSREISRTLRCKISFRFSKAVANVENL